MTDALPVDGVRGNGPGEIDVVALADGVQVGRRLDEFE
jgi:hypothetical protein